jgi:hypothetical protein
MKTYTVVGLYRDNRQVYVTSVEAKDVEAAVSLAKKEVSGSKDGKKFGHEINVLSVFEGEHNDVYGADEIIED